MCSLPKLGIEPVSPALAGRVFTTEPPGSPGHMAFDAFCALSYLMPMLNLELNHHLCFGHEESEAQITQVWSFRGEPRVTECV